MPPKVSIIIPTYNRAAELSETLDSIAAQLFTDWECLVVDDGSTDDTPVLMQRMSGSDARFRYLHRPKDRRKGANACRNFGFSQSSGEYIKWFDSDDLMHPRFLEHQVRLLDENDTLDFCACLGYYFKDSLDDLYALTANRIRHDKENVTNYLVGNLYFLTPAPLWRRSFLAGKVLFDESLSRGQEKEFHFRMISLQPNYLYTDERLYYVRRENESMSTTFFSNAKAMHSVLKVFDRFYEAVHNRQDLANKDALLNYLAFRQLRNIHQYKIYYDAGVGEFYRRTFPIMFKVIRHNRIGFAKKIRIVVGYLALAFGKGYGFLNYPEFDLRKAIIN